MKIKTKLTFGVGALFLMIFLLAALSGWYVNRLKKDTANILTANYNTLLYAKNMLLALEEIPVEKKAFTSFEVNLDKQRKNVTEVGEQQTTNAIAKHFLQLKDKPLNIAVVSSIRKDIALLMEQNMIAISRKSIVADKTAEHAILVISFAGALCFIIAFILLVNLPSNIADPIARLTASIRQIAGQNYKERIDNQSIGEFAELVTSFNSMAEKLEEYAESKLEKILKEKKRIEALVDNMRDPVIGFDEERRVIFVNEEALRITSLHKDQLLGRSALTVSEENDLAKDIFKDLLIPAANREKNAIKIYADDRESYFEKDVIDINVLPTGESEPKFIGQVVILKNITPFKELDLAKTNFIGTVSHEFKTPIAAIQMGVQLLENEQIGPLNTEQLALVNGIKDDSNRLLQITGELLNMTQVESGSIQINLHTTEIQPIIEYAVMANQFAANQKNIHFTIEVAPTAKYIVADNEKTAWVLTNFLSNAVRYSYEDSVIHIAVESIGLKTRFTVKDNGQGIEAKYLEKIFARYFRVPGSKKGGTGLGLSISKEFIEAQGGEIGVESDYGAGSSFYFSLRSAASSEN
ncbi:ATP-binding protein [Sphingobacterium sp. 2149]|uniref:HAMP domain-containing sensor histidine kinase n=1 Tax=Sphingobacterium sp. 2149 TaxID=2817763 RepID=UPI001AE49AF7|nr:ATP-binding protein [Sphingobacterium sp. 2149]MDR6736148.1 signal transduction histidine kinase [Sphingobacterium sp. 2149]